ncbi:hypothetical protein CapIbe_013311 [Capra ibex]
MAKPGPCTAVHERAMDLARQQLRGRACGEASVTLSFSTTALRSECRCISGFTGTEPQDQPPKPALSCVPRYLAVRTGFPAVREQAGQSAGPALGRNSREKGAAVMRSVLLLANSLSSRSG